MMESQLICIVFGFLIGIMFSVIVFGLLDLFGFHFEEPEEPKYPILKLENGTLIECINCEKVKK
jgi:hypothetical protein